MRIVLGIVGGFTVLIVAVNHWNLSHREGESGAPLWGPFEGDVVDIETLQPIIGAVCLAYWELGYALFGSHRYDVRAAVADEYGHFTIPRRDPPFLSFHVHERTMLYCVAPEYFWHAEFASRGNTSVRLRRSTALGRQEELGLYENQPDLWSGRLLELQNQINRARAAMRLPWVDLRDLGRPPATASPTPRPRPTPAARPTLSSARRR